MWADERPVPINSELTRDLNSNHFPRYVCEFVFARKDASGYSVFKFVCFTESLSVKFLLLNLILKCMCPARNLEQLEGTSDCCRRHVAYIQRERTRWLYSFHLVFLLFFSKGKTKQVALKKTGEILRMIEKPISICLHLSRRLWERDSGLWLVKLFITGQEKINNPLKIFIWTRLKSDEIGE